MASDLAKRARQWTQAFLGAHTRTSEVVNLARAVIREQSRERLGLSAAGVAFWFVIAIFPALIAVLMVLGLILDPKELAATIAELEKASPGALSGAVLKQVQAATQAQPSTLSLGFIISLLVVLWSTSTGYYNFSRGTLLAYGLPPKPYLKARGRAFVGAVIGMLVTAVIAVLTALTLSYAGQQTGLWRALLVAINALLGIAVVSVLLAGLFRFAVGRQHPRPLYLPGAALGAIGTGAVFVGFGVYVENAGRYQVVYGTLAGAIILMLSVYFSAYVVLIGAVLNAELSGKYRTKAWPGGAAEPPLSG